MKSSGTDPLAEGWAAKWSTGKTRSLSMPFSSILLVPYSLSSEKLSPRCSPIERMVVKERMLWETGICLACKVAKFMYMNAI